MARTVRDARLESREARRKLASQHEPHWKAIDGGMHIGYRKGARRASWLARYRPPGGRYIKSVLGIPDDTQDSDGLAILSFSEAQAKAREWFAEQIRKSKGLDHSGPYTVGHAMSDYLAWYKSHRKSLTDVTKRVNAFILPELKAIEVSELTTRQIRGWHQALAEAAPRARTRPGADQRYRPTSDDPDFIRGRKASANKVLTILKAALNHAWREGHVTSDNAWRRVKPFHDVDTARVRYLSTAECVRLVNACDPDFRHLVQAALLTGCRYGELTALRCGDVDLEAGTVHIRTSKSGKPRHVPLNDEGSEFFAGVTAGRPSHEIAFLRADRKAWGVSHQRRRLEKAARHAKVENVTFHILRHTYGSALAMQGVPMGVIAHALGHVDTRITEKHYAALAPSYVAEMIRTNLPRFGLGDPSKVVALKPSMR